MNKMRSRAYAGIFKSSLVSSTLSWLILEKDELRDGGVIVVEASR